jgi:hypothetical protein
MTVSGLRRVPLVRIRDFVLNLDQVSAVVYDNEERYDGYPWTITVSMSDGSEYWIGTNDEPDCVAVLEEFVQAGVSTTVEEPPL